jgi:hypothetical protein
VATGEHAIVMDTVRDVEVPAPLRAMLDASARGERVDDSLLVSELARMFELVQRTDADFDRLVFLLQPGALVTIATQEMAAHVVGVIALPDGSTIVQTSWSMAGRDLAIDAIDAQHPGWTSANGDPRGVPCFRASQIEVGAAGASYDDALYLLGDTVAFLR